MHACMKTHHLRTGTHHYFFNNKSFNQITDEGAQFLAKSIRNLKLVNHIKLGLS